MKKYYNLLPYLLTIVVAFYFLPLLISDTGTAMFVLLICIPLICFIISLIYGAKNGFNFMYSLLVALAFIPTIFIYYNYTAWPYVFAFGIISLIGNFVGKMMFYKKKKI